MFHCVVELTDPECAPGLLNILCHSEYLETETEKVPDRWVVAYIGAPPGLQVGRLGHILGLPGR
jgi:hypothetical protein